MWHRFYFNGSKCPKMCLIINRSVKTSWQLGLVWELVGKCHIFPGLGYKYNKKKKYFFIVLERTKFKPKLNFRYKLWKVLGPVMIYIRYESSLLECIRKCFGKLEGQSNTFNNRSKLLISPIFKHGNDCLQKGIPPTAVTLQPKNMT